MARHAHTSHRTVRIKRIGNKQTQGKSEREKEKGNHIFWTKQKRIQSIKKKRKATAQTQTKS